jgi:hypothetical protein
MLVSTATVLQAPDLVVQLNIWHNRSVSMLPSQLTAQPSPAHRSFTVRKSVRQPELYLLVT